MSIDINVLGVYWAVVAFCELVFSVCSVFTGVTCLGGGKWLKYADWRTARWIQRWTENIKAGIVFEMGYFLPEKVILY
jgi:hypothetical protein